MKSEENIALAPQRICKKVLANGVAGNTKMNTFGIDSAQNVSECKTSAKLETHCNSRIPHTYCLPSEVKVC